MWHLLNRTINVGSWSLELTSCTVTQISSGNYIWEKEICGETTWKKKLFLRSNFFHLAPSSSSPPKHTHPYLGAEWGPDYLKLFYCILSFLHIKTWLTLPTPAACEEVNGACSLLSTLTFLQHLIKWENYSLLHRPQITNIIFFILCGVWAPQDQKF